MLEQDIKDPTKYGTKGLRGLKGVNNKNVISEEEAKKYNLQEILTGESYRERIHRENATTSPIQHIGFVGINDSKYDKHITSASQLEDLNNTRAELQPWYDKVMSGIAKGAVLAGTTFASGTLGLLVGGLQAGIERDRSKLWNNEFNIAMKAINDYSEQLLPNYYTNSETQDPWYEHILSANFLGDKLIKNLGFTVGAIYSGGLTTGVLKAAKLPTLVKAISGSTGLAKGVLSTTGALISAVNEGNIEALNGSLEWKEYQEQIAKDRFEDRKRQLSIYEGTELYDTLIAEEELLLKENLNKIKEDATKVGNGILLANLPILMISNLVQFGKLYANGFKTAKRATSLALRDGQYIPKTTVKKGILRGIGNSLSEGTEEISQKAAQISVGKYYEKDVNNFYKSSIDPDAEQESLSIMNALAEGITETLGDGNSWEEFTIGAITGALGVPSFRSFKNSNGERQFPIKLEGGLFGTIRDTKDEILREQEIADYLNKRIQSPEFIKYYQGFIRHNKYQDDMDKAAELGKEREFKNAEHAQLISDIIMFDSAGKLDDLLGLINTNDNNYTEEDLRSIVDNTTEELTKESGEKSYKGPFIDSKGKPMYITEEGKNQMIEKLNQNKKDLIDTINSYRKIKDKIDDNSNEILSDEQLTELTWIKSQIQNWSVRNEQLSEDTKNFLHRIIDNLQQESYYTQQAKNKEGRNNTELTDNYKELDNKLNILNNNIQTIKNYADGNSLLKSLILKNNPELISFIEEYVQEGTTDITEDELQEFKIKTEDIVKNFDAIKSFNEKYTEYVNNPENIITAHVDALNEVAQEDFNKKIQTYIDDLSNLQTTQEVREYLNSIEDSKIKDEVISKLRETKQSLIKDYTETNIYNKEIEDILNNSKETEDIKEKAKVLFKKLLENSNNLQELSDINNSILNNEDLIYNDELSPEENEIIFNRVKNLLIPSMLKLNDDKLFKDRIKNKYVEEPDISNNKEKNTTTGNDNVSTVPTQESSPFIINNNSIGEITSEELYTENSEINSTEEKPKDVLGTKRLYWRPAIPEFHIEEVKKGDFRTFKEVIMEKEGLDFSIIYDYLESNGAFKYVNEGNLKENSEVGFMIDPVFEDKVSNKEWHKSPTIFLVDKSNNQIIGSLDESDYSIDRYEGLRETIDNIHKEYNKSTNKEDKFYSSLSTTVNSIIEGKNPYINEEKDLSKVIKEGESIIFGIIKNGIMVTNNAISKDLIVNPLNISNKNGRLYILTKNANGKYSPIAIRTKHFNKNEFDINSIELSNSIYAKEIKESIRQLSEVETNADIKDAYSKLSRLLYLGDIHFDLVESTKGKFLRISKVEKDENGREIFVEKDEKQIRANNKLITLVSNNSEVGTLDLSTGGTFIPVEPTIIDKNTVINNIINTLFSFNPPLQVDAGLINSTGYNKRIINSNIVSSNINSISIRGAGFTLNPLDKEGNIIKSQKPINHISLEEDRTIRISIEGFSGYVNLVNYDILDLNGKEISLELDKNIMELVFTEAWSINAFSDIITPNTEVVKTPYNKYYNRKTKKFIGDFNPPVFSPNIETIINKLYDEQENIDKEETTSEYYLIEEEGGYYHEYQRVSKRIGSNWIESTNYSPKSLEYGSTVDNIIRNFFSYKDQLQKPDNISEEAYFKLIESLSKIEENLDKAGEKFLANNIVLFTKDGDTRIAGEVDILAVDKFGNFKIYDIKTSRHSFYPFTNKHGETVDYFNNKSSKQIRSTKEQYTLQLSAYKNLFENMTGIPVSSLGILPFVISYNDKEITDIHQEKGIIIQYNEDVNVPKIKIEQKKISDNLDIFNSSLEQLNPVDIRVNDKDFENQNTKEGYFIKNGRLSKGRLLPIGKFNGLELFITRTPIYSTNEGKTDSYLAKYDYDLIFPNGAIKEMIFTPSANHTIQQAVDAITKAINSNIPKLMVLYSELPELNIEKKEPVSDAKKSNDSIDKANNKKINRIRRNRIVNNSNNTIWNQEEELNWLNKVLPQLNNEQRIKIQKGLINLSEFNTEAWGLFNNGIIILSDIAAKGTTYHEAFHVVFNMILNQSEQDSLLNKAKERYGDKSNLELEEELAESFREYIMNREEKGLINKIKIFFEDLYILINNWFSISPNINYYFYNINNRRYSKNKLNERTIEEFKPSENNITIDFDNLNSNDKNLLLNKGWTREKFNNISQEEKNKALECLHI